MDFSLSNHESSMNSEKEGNEHHDTALAEMYPMLQSLQERMRGIWHEGRLTNKDYFDEQYINITRQLRSLIRLSEAARSEKLKNLSDYVRRRILEIQNPPDCKKAQLLVYNYGRYECGFGCTVHYILRVFLLAIYAKRTLVLATEGWAYDKQGWEHYLLPIEKCKHQGNLEALPELSEETRHKRIVRSDGKSFDAFDWYVPKNILDELNGIHSDLFAWWIGQFASYVFRLQPSFERELKETANRIGFSKSVSGLHIRWGAKLDIEASRYAVDEYMDFVETWHRIVEDEGRQEKLIVYVATEELAARKELKAQYHNYTFIGAGYVNESKDANNFQQSNYGLMKDALPSILADIYFLEKCDYVVCTFSSNVCRLLYELRSAKLADAVERLQSLDYFYHLAGRPKYRIVQNHRKGDNDRGMDLKIGDVYPVMADLLHNPIDGFIRLDLPKGRFAKVPTYKVEKIVNSFNFQF